jgi:hypothetical protein
MLLYYFLIIIPVLITTFLLFSYWQERKYRNKPFYKLSDIGWRSHVPTPDTQVVHSVAFLGDVGLFATDGTDPILHLLQQWRETFGSSGTAVFLGDNLYPVGLPPEGHRHRARAVERLDLLLHLLKQSEGRSIFLSGNHDWNKGREDGYQRMLLQEQYIVEGLEDQQAYQPRKGCPGPVALQLAEGLLLLVINTQWFVQRGEKPLGSKYGCPYEDIEGFFQELNAILRQNRHQRVLVAAHHPLYSNALHGGKFTIRQHIFPLTAANKRFLIPLPIFGSLYPFYRQLFGAREDMSHTRYRKMRKRLLRIFNRHTNIVYVAGHDHNLQHFERHYNHYIVSGSGSKTSFVKKGGKATFTLEQRGFFVVNYYDNGEMWLETVVVADNETAPTKGTVIFRKELKLLLQPALAG